MHPEPHVGDASPAPAAGATADTFEHEPAWSPATPDFVAAMEAREQAAPATPITAAAESAAEETGPVFELSGDLPPAADPIADFVLTNESLLEIEAAGEQLSILDEALAEVDLGAAGVDADLAPVLNFEAAPEPVVEAPPPPAPLPVAEPDPVVPPPAAAAPPVAAQTPAAWTATVAPSFRSKPAPLGTPVAAAQAAAATPVVAGTPVVPAAPAVSNSARTVEALEKMLRQINSRRLELASEYSPS